MKCQQNLMKTTLFSILILLFVSTLFLPNTFAADVPYITFSPDASTLASAGNNDQTIRLWDVHTGQHKTTLRGGSDYFRTVAFSPDGETLAGGSDESTIWLWDVHTGQHKTTLKGHGGDVWSVAFSPDGGTLASGSDDNTIRLWDAVTGQSKATLTGHTADVDAVAFSPDGGTLASGSSDNTIRLWDAVTGQPKATLTGHTENVRSVAFSPDGGTLASGSDDNTIRLWDAVTGQPKATLTGHTENVRSVAFSPDGGTLASGSDDNTIRLWDAVTGQPKATLTGHTGNVRSVAFSPDGGTLASGSNDFTIRLWQLTSTRVSITPSSAESPAIGEQLTINVSIAEGENVGGYQATVQFNHTTLRYVGSANGDYLPAGAFFVPPVVAANRVTLGATTLAGVRNGGGTLATLTFEVLDVKESTLTLPEVIITDSAGRRLPFIVESGRVIEPAPSRSSATIYITPSPVVSPAIGEWLVFNVGIVRGQNVVGYQLTLQFDETALQYISSRSGGYLNEPIAVSRSENRVTLAATSRSEVGNGNGPLATVMFEVRAVKASEVPTIKTSTVSISEVILTRSNGFGYIPTFESARVQVEVVALLMGDVNGDRVVNILDLALVGSHFGQAWEGNEDVNGDGVVNIVDLVLVASVFGAGGAAPSAHPRALEIVSTENVQHWLTQAKQLDVTDPTYLRGIAVLEQLLAALTPKETVLLPNYPNPFNPETWIPYHLADAADVTLTIYDTKGAVVRQLDLGYQSAGYYTARSRAAYWDGRNESEESVASGVYFYQLRASRSGLSVPHRRDYIATRRMVIVK